MTTRSKQSSFASQFSTIALGAFASFMTVVVAWSATSPPSARVQAPPAFVLPAPSALDAEWTAMTLPGPWPLVRPRSAVQFGGKLVVSGGFQAVGLTRATNVVTWDGVHFGSLGELPAEATQLLVWNGSLYAATLEFPSKLYRWDSSTWTPIASFGGLVTKLQVIGGDLVAAGDFGAIDGSTALHAIARFDGTSWHGYGAGLPASALVTDVVEVGSTIYVGLRNSFTPGAFQRGVGYFDGTSWTVPGAALNGDVSSLATDGANLFASGTFTRSGASLLLPGLARWDGGNWTSVGSTPGVPNGANLIWHAGELLAVRQKGLDAIQRFDGAGWLGYGDHMAAGIQTIVPFGVELAALVEPLAGGPQQVFARTGSGANWTPAQEPWSATMNGLAGSTVDAIVWNDELIVAGGQQFVGTGTSYLKAAFESAWNGSSWSAPTTGLGPTPRRLATWQGNLVACGFLTASNGNRGAAWWDGATWQDFPSSIFTNVNTLTEHLGAVYAGGDFTTGPGLLPGTLPHLARWDGATWNRVADGLVTAFPDEGSVNASLSFGALLAIGGHFSFASGVPVSNFAFWDGVGFSNSGGGFDGDVSALALHGGQLVAGGAFAHAGGGMAPGAARWNGSAWQPMGQNAIDVYDFTHIAGVLYAVGEFRQPDGSPSNTVARWIGDEWQTLGSGAPSGSRGLQWVEGYHDDLFAGGAYPYAFGKVIHGITRLPVANTAGVDDSPKLTHVALTASPNPGRGQTSFAFALPFAGHARLTVLDAAGRIVTTLVDGDLAAGLHELRWSASVRPGMYFARLEAPGGVRRIARVVRFE